MSLLRRNASTAVSHEVESTHRSTPKSEGCNDESGAEQRLEGWADLPHHLARADTASVGIHRGKGAQTTGWDVMGDLGTLRTQKKVTGSKSRIIKLEMADARCFSTTKSAVLLRKTASYVERAGGGYGSQCRDMAPR